MTISSVRLEFEDFLGCERVDFKDVKNREMAALYTVLVMVEE